MTHSDAGRVLQLTKHLIALDTAGGGEDTAAAVTAALLERAGFDVAFIPLAPAG